MSFHQARVATGVILALATPFASYAQDQLTWDSAEAYVEETATEGFSGAVLLVRDDEVVLHEGYGLANRELEIPNAPETCFVIGSTPIDFTRVGILLLAERGKIDLDDPVSKYLSGVPRDKEAITIRHCMTGSSGLQNFHGLDGDTNPDLMWISRDEMVRRVMRHDLRFAPGSGKAHSHSAWGLVAAIIEIVSGQSYEEFTQDEIYGPSGMTKTGFYGDQDYADEEIAIGYGGARFGEINSPMHWPKTSWLIKGSGGQISRPIDMYRFHKALHGGKILDENSLSQYFRGGPGMNAGGSRHGYAVFYTQGPGSYVFVFTNDISQVRQTEHMAETLAWLIEKDRSPTVTLGIRLAVDEKERLIADEVLPGSAAHLVGIEPGDVLLKANGTRLGENVFDVIYPLLRANSPIILTIERNGKKKTLTVEPLPKAEDHPTGPYVDAGRPQAEQVGVA